MTINLNNLNLSLDTFNKIASGSYNIGEVRLTADGKGLTKINNHKNTWFFSNNTSVSSEEALAIKNAFVKALSDAGIAPDVLDTIRKQLGITNALELLSASTVKPLSRQEIREILDQNAETINSSRMSNGEQALKTSDQIYAKMSKSTKETHQAIRDLRNSDLASSRKMVMNRDAKNLMTILMGEFAGKQEQSGDIAEMGCAMKSALITLLGGSEKPIGNANSVKKSGEPVVTEENGTIQVTFRLNNKKFYKVDTKLTMQDFLRKMDSVPQSDSWEYIDDKEKALEKLTQDVLPEQNFFDKLKRAKKIDVAQEVAMKQLVKDIFSENFHDKKLTNLLHKTMLRLLQHAGELRSRDSLREKVAALKENLEALRQLENTRPGALDAGLDILVAGDGKCFSPKHFQRILESADKLQLDLIAASKKPTQEEIHKILLASLLEQCSVSLPEDECFGADEATMLRSFILRFAVIKLSPQMKMDIRTTLMSKNFEDLYRIYLNVMNGSIEGNKGFKLTENAKALGLNLTVFPDELNHHLSRELGIDITSLPYPEDADDSTKGISDEILNTFKPQQANQQ